MAEYKIIWVSRLYGESIVEADSPEEARVNALKGKDTNFEELDPNNDWEIDPETDSIILIK